ncbi:MAG: ATP-dependent zinc metalloprotease FtsH [Clostridia bacterium]|nr:ATP-dependent zinc metalloprotease FtsH [Clostridia bacterium]
MYMGKEQQKDLKYYEVVEFFDKGQVSEVDLNMNSGAMTFKLEGEDKTYKYTVPNVNLFINDVHEGLREYNQKNPDKPIEFDYEAGTSGSWILSVLPSLLLTLGLIVLMSVMFRKMNSSINSENNRAMNFGKARVKRADDETKKVTFKDVAGADEEKEELTELVEFLKAPEEFSKLGARIPKGVLLVGPPGTGKTLLARAVAGEANAPFFSISGSDFVEMYVGVGASRVRDLFKEAKKSQPSIIFIDEIDAVGRHRGAGMGGGHDEREQTLNQLLVEMDGFGANDGVIVIAATNRPDILDPALLRPGRFDRQVTVGYPDVKGREEILQVHAKNKPLAPDVDLHQIAATTVGFTGADLENLLNEAALLAAKRKKLAITMDEIEEATMKVVVGSEKKSRKISEKDKKITAYHEAGHAISSYYLENQDPVTHISIVPRGMAAGFTLYTPEKDNAHMLKSRMLDDIVSLLGGRVAEQIIFNDISTGASNDIQRASEISRNMITKYGMSEKLGPIAFGSGNNEVFLGKDYNHMRNYSENIAAVIDEEVERIIGDAYKRTETILTEHIDQLHIVAEALIKLEKIDKEQFESLMTTGELPQEPIKEETVENVENAEVVEVSVEENTATDTEEIKEIDETSDNA